MVKAHVILSVSPGTWIIPLSTVSTPSCPHYLSIHLPAFISVIRSSDTALQCWRQEALALCSNGPNVQQQGWQQLGYSKKVKYSVRKGERRGERREKPRSFDFYYNTLLGLFYFSITIVTVLWLINETFITSMFYRKTQYMQELMLSIILCVSLWRSWHVSALENGNLPWLLVYYFSLSLWLFLSLSHTHTHVNSRWLIYSLLWVIPRFVPNHMVIT